MLPDSEPVKAVSACTRIALSGSKLGAPAALHLDDGSDQRNIDADGRRHTRHQRVEVHRTTERCVGDGRIIRVRADGDGVDAQLRGASRRRIDLTLEVADAGTGVVELGHQGQLVRRIHPTPIDPVPLDVELPIVRVVQRIGHRSTATWGQDSGSAGAGEERVSRVLGGTGLPENRYLVVSGYEIEGRCVWGGRQKKSVIEHLLSHERFPQQRAGHHPEFLLLHPAILVSIVEPEVSGETINRIDARIHAHLVAEYGGVFRTNIAGWRAGRILHRSGKMYATTIEPNSPGPRVIGPEDWKKRVSEG